MTMLFQSIFSLQVQQRLVSLKCSGLTFHFELSVNSERYIYASKYELRNIIEMTAFKSLCSSQIGSTVYIKYQEGLLHTCTFGQTGRGNYMYKNGRLPEGTRHVIIHCKKQYMHMCHFRASNPLFSPISRDCRYCIWVHAQSFAAAKNLRAE